MQARAGFGAKGRCRGVPLTGWCTAAIRLQGGTCPCLWEISRRWMALSEQLQPGGCRAAQGALPGCPSEQRSQSTSDSCLYIGNREPCIVSGTRNPCSPSENRALLPFRGLMRLHVSFLFMQGIDGALKSSFELLFTISRALLCPVLV